MVLIVTWPKERVAISRPAMSRTSQAKERLRAATAGRDDRNGRHARRRHERSAVEAVEAQRSDPTRGPSRLRRKRSHVLSPPLSAAPGQPRATARHSARHASAGRRDCCNEPDVWQPGSRKRRPAMLSGADLAQPSLAAIAVARYGTDADEVEAGRRYCSLAERRSRCNNDERVTSSPPPSATPAQYSSCR
jgi:hypothetical protein